MQLLTSARGCGFLFHLAAYPTQCSEPSDLKPVQIWMHSFFGTVTTLTWPQIGTSLKLDT